VYYHLFLQCRRRLRLEIRKARIFFKLPQSKLWCPCCAPAAEKFCRRHCVHAYRTWHLCICFATYPTGAGLGHITTISCSLLEREKLTKPIPNRCLHGLAPRYLSDYIQRVADSNRRRLRSWSSSQLVIRRTRLSTVGDRAFPVAWKPPLEQSAARRHLSSNADCFPVTPQNSSLFPIISFLTVFGF